MVTVEEVEAVTEVETVAVTAVEEGEGAKVLLAVEEAEEELGPGM